MTKKIGYATAERNLKSTNRDKVYQVYAELKKYMEENDLKQQITRLQSDIKRFALKVGECESTLYSILLDERGEPEDSEKEYPEDDRDDRHEKTWTEMDFLAEMIVSFSTSKELLEHVSDSDGIWERYRNDIAEPVLDELRDVAAFNATLLDRVAMKSIFDMIEKEAIEDGEIEEREPLFGRGSLASYEGDATTDDEDEQQSEEE